MNKPDADILIQEYLSALRILEVEAPSALDPRTTVVYRRRLLSASQNSASSAAIHAPGQPRKTIDTTHLDKSPAHNACWPTAAFCATLACV
jgi:hypothetical protein